LLRFFEVKRSFAFSRSGRKNYHRGINESIIRVWRIRGSLEWKLSNCFFIILTKVRLMRPLTRAHVAHVASETHVRASVSPRTYKHAVRINQGRIGEALVIPTCRGQRLLESLCAVSLSFLFLFFSSSYRRDSRVRPFAFASVFVEREGRHILSYRKQLKCQHVTFIFFFSFWNFLACV